jgi:hypothetical protein
MTYFNMDLIKIITLNQNTMKSKLPLKFLFKPLYCFLFLLFTTLGHAQLSSGDGGSGNMYGSLTGIKYKFEVQLGDVDCGTSTNSKDDYVQTLNFKINNEEIFRIVRVAETTGIPNFSFRFGRSWTSRCFDGGLTFDWWLVAPDQETLDAIERSFGDNGSEYNGYFTYTLPSRFLISGNLNVYAENTNTQTARTPWNVNISSPILPPQSNLRITQGCSSVTLGWDKLKVAAPFAFSEFKYQVYKGNTLLTTLNGDAIEYSALNVNNESEFKVKLLWNDKEIESKTQTG